jgi:hypothetical protein
MLRKGVLKGFNVENGAHAFWGKIFSYLNVSEFGVGKRCRSIDAALIMNCVGISSKGTLALDTDPNTGEKEESSLCYTSEIDNRSFKVRVSLHALHYCYDCRLDNVLKPLCP